MVRLRTILRLFAAHPIWGAVAFSSLTLIVLWALVPQVAQAASLLENALIQIVGFIVGFFVDILGEILIKFIGILVAVAQFNNFIDAPAVRIGWSVTRDISNMFFIVALLLIAVGTMFRIDQYRYSRTLQKLIMMAILINFSKAIAGFFIDFSQVVMLTFVNAFKDQAAGSLAAGFGIDKLLTIAKNVNPATGDIDPLSVLGSLFAALIMVFVATVIVAIFTILLIQRIIMLWIYIVLAPTAYMVAVLPGTLGSWWSSWWRDFSQYLIKGPVIAFFLWLALTVITLSTGALIPTTSTIEQSSDLEKKTFDDPTFVSQATTGTAIINYLVAIGMLIAGLQQAAKSSGAAGAVAGKWMGNFNRWGSSIATSPIRGAKGIGGFAGRRAGNLTAPAGYAAASGTLGLLGRLPGGAGRYFTRQQGKVDDARFKAIGKEVPEVKSMSNAQLDTLMNRGSIPIGMEGRRFYNSVLKENVRRKRFTDMNAPQMQHYMQMNGITATAHPTNGGLRFDARNRAALEDFQSNFKSHPEILQRIGDATGLQDNARAQMLRTMRGLTPGEWGQISNDAINPENGVTRDVMHEAFGALDGDGRTNVMNRLRTRIEMRDFLQPAALAAAAAGGAHVEDVEDEDEELAHEDIDRVRQQRTAELHAKHGDDFEKSAEYMANPGQFYSHQQMVQNQRQQQRVMQRLSERKAGVAEVTSLNRFSRGQSDMLAVSDTMLAQAGVKPTAGGYTRDKKSVARIASVFNQQLTGDVKAIETQLAQLATEEQRMQTPNSKLLDASGRPMTAAQANPEKLQDIQARRTALEARKVTIQNAQKRLQDPKSLESLQFINTDRAGVDARTILAEEKMHKNLDTLDPDRTMRNDLKQQFSTEEFAEIVQDMRVRSGDEKMSEQRAFDEYLTKGLVNRGRWGDKSDNAVQLKAGIALAVKASQEKRQAAEGEIVNLNVDDLDEAPNIAVPQKAGAGRYIADRVQEGYATVKRPITTRLEQRAQEERVQAEQATQQSAAAAVQRQEAARQSLLQAQQAQQQEEAKLAAIKKQNSSKAADYQKSYDQNRAVYEDKTKSRAERDRAYDVMGAYANSIESLKKDVDAQEGVVEKARQSVMKKRSDLGSTVPQPRAATDQDVEQPASTGDRIAEVGRKASRLINPRGKELDQLDEEIRTHLPKNFKAFSEKEKKSLLEKPMQERLEYYRKVATGAAQVRQPMQTNAGPKSARATSSRSTNTSAVVDAEPASNVTNVTNITNVTQNITNAFKAAPPDIRGKLQAINSEALDSALKNSIVWRGLMGYIKNNTAEILKSEKLSDLGREELQKRIGKLQGHMDEGNAEAFKNEFGELQSIFGGNSGGGSESASEV